MSDDTHPQSSKSEDNDVTFGTPSLIGTRIMNLMFGFPLLVIMTGFMFYAAIDQKQVMYLYVGVIMLIVTVTAARVLFSVPTASSVRHDDHQQFAGPDTGHEN